MPPENRPQLFPSPLEGRTYQVPELPLFGVETLRSRMDESLLARKAPMTLLLVFAGVAFVGEGVLR